METTLVGLYGEYIRVILGLYKDNGKENGNLRWKVRLLRCLFQ